jgi:5-methylcytosine-specific restriction protein A
MRRPTRHSTNGSSAKPHAHLYRTARWLKRRATHLAREPLCRYCQMVGRITPATVADHVVPHRGDVSLFFGGELQSLCATCHSAIKQAEEHGNIRGCSVDGVPFGRSDW